MYSKILFSGLLSVASTLASAGWISADQFQVGTDVTNAIPGVTLGWLEHTALAPIIQQYGSVVRHRDDNLQSDQYFGGPTSASTSFNTANPAAHGAPLSATGAFSAFTISFSTPVRSFGFSEDGNFPDPFYMFLYDPLGGLIGQQLISPERQPGCDSQMGLIHCFSAKDLFNFNYDVGSIQVGSSDSAGYISGVFVPYATVPEPNSLALLIMGLFGLGFTRRLFRE